MGKGGATIAIVTDRVLFPRARGNSSRIIELVRSLRESGFRVVLVARRPYSRFMKAIPGVRATLGTIRAADSVYWVPAGAFGRGSPLDFDWEPYAARLQDVLRRESPVAVIAQYIWMAPVLDTVPPGVLTLLDTHDLMHSRSDIYGGSLDGSWVQCTRAEEAALAARASVVMAIQEHERRAFAAMVPHRTVIRVPHAVSGARMPPSGPAPVVMFVGSRIEGNVEGLLRFIRESWPVVRTAERDARLLIYGQVAEAIGEVAEGVAKVGFARDLEPAYRGAAVVVNPVTLGTGLKIKTVEAMAHSRAVVSTSCGAAGLENAAGDALVIEDDFVRFGEAVASLLRDAPRRHRLETAAGAYAREEFSAKAALRELLEVLPPPDPEG
jgi:glycosyltransferase involved in cell wall biosynthesis